MILVTVNFSRKNTENPKMQMIINHLRRYYRHYIAIVITLGFIACFLLFPLALGRLIEGGRDFGLSVAYYVCEIFDIPCIITPTVNDMPQIPFFPFPNAPVSPSVPIPDNFSTVSRRIGRHIGNYGRAAITSCIISIGSVTPCISPVKCSCS